MMKIANKFIQLHELSCLLQDSAEGLTLEDIQHRYGVSLRTAQRWIKDIREVYAHMEEFSLDGRKIRWRISRRDLNHKLALSAQDLSILNISAGLLKTHNLAGQADQLFMLEKKLKNIITLDKQRKRLEDETETLLKIEGLAFSPGPRFHLDESILKSLRTALLNQQQIKIKYYNKSSDKHSYNILEPYGILYSERNHYLLARHSDNYYADEIHHFILHNIKSIELLNLHYQLPDGFNLNDYCRDMFGAFKEPAFEVEWLFDKQVANEVKHYLFHPSQQMIENKDGSITIKFKAGGAVEMSWFLYMWGDMVRVIKPVDFWQRVEEY